MRAFSRVLSRAYPRASPGRLTALAADPASGHVALAGEDDDPAGSCRLRVWLPHRGIGRPRLRAKGVKQLRLRRVGGGWVAVGCARGAYSLRAR